jgi:hypothetical protein
MSMTDFFSQLCLLDFAHGVARQIIPEHNGLWRFIRGESLSTEADQFFAAY